MPHQLQAITAENWFTVPLTLRAGDLASVSVTGTFSGTITLQRRMDGMVAYADIANPDGTVGWTAPIQATYYADEAQLLRVGIKTGGYGSGTATVRLGTDRQQIFGILADGMICAGAGAFSASPSLTAAGLLAAAGAGRWNYRAFQTLMMRASASGAGAGGFIVNASLLHNAAVFAGGGGFAASAPAVWHTQQATSTDFAGRGRVQQNGFVTG